MKRYYTKEDGPYLCLLDRESKETLGNFLGTDKILYNWHGTELAQECETCHRKFPPEWDFDEKDIELANEMCKILNAQNEERKKKLTEQLWLVSNTNNDLGKLLYNRETKERHILLIGKKYVEVEVYIKK